MPKDVTKNDKKEKKEKKHFFRDFKAELKKVIWPTPKQLVNNTIAVITIVLITTVIVFALDFVFKTINNYVFEGLKSVVNTTTDSSEIVNEEDSNSEEQNENNENSDNTDTTDNTQNTDNTENANSSNNNANSEEKE